MPREAELVQGVMKLELVKANNLATVREKYIEVIEQTKGMDINARWVYGQHPTDALIQSYIDREEMYLYMDGENIAGIVAIPMYQGEDYRDITWGNELRDDGVATLHILTVTPEYQGKGIPKSMMSDIISLARQNGKKAVRLDTLASNLPAQHMYTKLGFTYRGKQTLYAENIGWTDFLYYEFVL